MLAALTLFCVSFGAWVNRAHEQRDAVAAVRHASAPFGNAIELRYDYEDERSPGFGIHLHSRRDPSPVSPVLINWLGEDFFHTVTSAQVPNGGPAPDDALALISRLPRLRFLTISTFQTLSDLGFGRLATMGNLQRLRIDNAATCHEDAFRKISRLSRLESLRMGRVLITDDGLMSLSKLSSLKELSLSRPERSVGIVNISKKGLAALSRLTTLHELHVESWSFAGGDVQCLAALRHLESLSLEDTSIADKDLEFLTSLVNLRDLSLAKCRITGAGLVHVPLSVEWIALDGTGLNDDSIAALARLPNLKGVSVKETPATAVGLEQLKGCPKLQNLSVDRFVEPALKQLRRALPNVAVEY